MLQPCSQAVAHLTAGRLLSAQATAKLTRGCILQMLLKRKTVDQPVVQLLQVQGIISAHGRRRENPLVRCVLFPAASPVHA